MHRSSSAIAAAANSLGAVGSMVAWFAVTMPAEGFAQERAVLVYETRDAPECPDERAFRDAVAARLGYDPFTDDAVRTIVATLAHGHGTYAFELEVYESGALAGSRTLEADGADCQEFAVAAAVAVSVMLDPLEPPPREPPPREPPPREVVARSEHADLDVPATRSARATPGHEGEGGMTADAQLGLALTAGLTPAVAFGPALSLALRFDSLAIGLDARLDWPMVDAETAGGDRVEASVADGGPAACLIEGVFVSCLAVRAGAFIARGPDLAKTERSASFFAEAAARIAVDLPLAGHLSFVGGAELRVPLVETELAIEGRVVWSAPALGGSVFACLRLNIS
jgi:hypothetical protein